MPRSLTSAGVALAALLMIVSPASAKLRHGPAGTAFYTPPAKLPGKAHGDVVWWRTAKGGVRIPGAASNKLVLYRSTGVGGKVAVSGSVAVPKGRAPRGGWPVVTWAHGTTGIADRCAPTRLANGSRYVHPLMTSWLKRGWAVVQTDYEGLGTPGVHPYLNGVSEGHGVLDIVRAARKLDRRIGRSVIITGHSQGGQAALWAAALARKYTPELQVRGTDAFAPASHLSEQLPLVTALKQPSPGLSALSITIARGLDVSDPSLHVPSLLSGVAAAHYGLVDTRCLGALAAPDAFGSIAPADLFKPGIDFAPMSAALDRLDDPENLTIRTPVRIDQGEADTTVFPTFTRQTVDAYEARGMHVTYQTYPGVPHGTIPIAAGSQATAWMAKRLR